MGNEWQQLLSEVKKAASDRSPEKQALLNDLVLKAEVLLLNSSSPSGSESETESLLRTILSVFSESPERENIAGLYLRVARWAEWNGKNEFAVALFKKCGAEAARNQNIALQVQALEELGEVYRRRGEFAQASECQSNAGNLAASNGLDALNAHAINNLGVIDVETGNLDSAESKFRSALALAENSQEDILKGHLLNNLGVIQSIRGNFQQAYTEFIRALPIRKACNDVQGFIETSHNLGKCMMEMAEYDTSGDYINQALNHARSLGNAYLIADILLSRAELMLKISQYEIAVKCAEEALAEFKKFNDPLGCADAIRIIGSGFLSNGRLEEAENFLRNAQKIAREYAHPLGVAETSELLMEVHFQLKNFSRFEAAYRQAKNAFTAINNQSALNRLNSRYNEIKLMISAAE